MSTRISFLSWLMFAYLSCMLSGVTQELIDETRAATEVGMLSDMQNIVNNNGDIEFRGRTGETPVSGATTK